MSFNDRSPNLNKHVFPIITIICIVLLVYKIHEPFPVKSVSKTAVLNLVNHAQGRMVRIPSHHNSYQWYISKNEKADENLKELLKEKGWTFVKKEDDSYYFEGVQGDIIVQSEIWNDRYTIFHFPEGI
jgi:hypothetical protein